VFAALSLGPAGLADRLEGFPAIAAPGAGANTQDSLLCVISLSMKYDDLPRQAWDNHEEIN
jgi:hypothetical protein